MEPPSREPTAAVTPARQPARRRTWLWIIAILVIVGGLITVGYVAMRQRERSQIAGQVERLRLLGDALSDYADRHEGALPDEVPADVSATDRAGRHLGRAELLTDVATGKPVVYRVVPPAGERVRRDPMGERLIAWSPEPSYRGRRAVLLNDFTAGLVADSAIDFAQQRLLLSDPLNKVAPTAAEGVDEGGGEDEEMPATEPTTAPATGP